MHHVPTLAYLVADGSKARLMLRHGDGRYEVLASFGDHGAEHRPRRDTRGRVFASVGGARSAIPEPTSEAAPAAFASGLAAAIEQFVIVAPQRMLAAIREALGSASAHKLVGELAKNLTELPEDKLRHTLDGLADRPIPA